MKVNEDNNKKKRGEDKKTGAPGSRAHREQTWVDRLNLSGFLWLITQLQNAAASIAAMNGKE
jgi:hypothetical protein